MFQMVIKAETAQELKYKILELAEAHTEIKSDAPEGLELDHNRESRPVEETTQHVISNGQEWRPLPGRGNAFIPFPIAETSAEEPELPTVPERKTAPPILDIPVTPGGSTGPVNAELDSKGMPFDLRIHSSNGAKVKDGSWKYKRGVVEAFIEQVEAELRARMQVHGSAVPEMRDPIPAPPAPTVHVQMPTAEVYTPAVAATPVKSFEPIPVPKAFNPGTYDLQSFRNNIPTLMMTLINEGKLTKEYMEQLKTYFGVKEIWELGNDEVKAKELFENFVSCGFVSKVG